MGSSLKGIISLIYCEWVKMLPQCYNMILTAVLANLYKEKYTQKVLTRVLAGMRLLSAVLKVLMLAKYTGIMCA